MGGVLIQLVTFDGRLKEERRSELSSDPGKELIDGFQQCPDSTLEIDAVVGVG